MSSKMVQSTAAKFCMRTHVIPV